MAEQVWQRSPCPLRDIKTFLIVNRLPQSKSVLQAFQAERTYIYVSTKAKKPDPRPQELLTDLVKSSEAINSIRESNRASTLFNHLTTVAEGVVPLGWVFETRPADFVTRSFEGAQFYGNRVLKEYKEKYAITLKCENK